MGIPQLNANDVNILYQLAQSGQIKVSQIPVIQAVLDKCVTIIQSAEKKRIKSYGKRNISWKRE